MVTRIKLLNLTFDSAHVYPYSLLTQVASKETSFNTEAGLSDTHPPSVQHIYFFILTQLLFKTLVWLQLI